MTLSAQSATVLPGASVLTGHVPGRRIRALLAGVVLCVACIDPARAVLIIDFEASVGDDRFQRAYPAGGAPYVEDGFRVRASAESPQLLAFNPARDIIGNGPDGGSKHMASFAPLIPGGGPQGAAMLIDRADGALFSILALNVSEYSAVFDVPLNLQFIGVSEVGTVVQVFLTDGVNDGTGPLVDFERVVLEPEFTNLMSFEIVGLPGTRSGFLAVDTIVTRLVPVPGVVSLLGVGLALAGLVRVYCRRPPPRRD